MYYIIFTKDQRLDQCCKKIPCIYIPKPSILSIAYSDTPVVIAIQHFRFQKDIGAYLKNV